jgi:hypothetical protein
MLAKKEAGPLVSRPVSSAILFFIFNYLIEN